MREILFRGKRIDNGEWVYGSLFRKNDKSIIITGYISGYKKLKGSCEVASESISEYTGLEDKNGIMIFEGDIVKYNYAFFGCNVSGKGAVVFSNGSFGIKLCTGTERFLKTNKEVHEVIGNIHDNPELLGGE